MGYAFDLSDVDTTLPIDHLDTVLDLAGEILLENAPAPGNTRTERIARWVVLNVGGETFSVERAGAITRYTIGSKALHVVRCGSVFGIQKPGGPSIGMNLEQARAVVVALIRAIEAAER